MENPFVPSFGNRPAHIVGRKQLVHSLLKGLNRPIGSRERCTLILGQRGMGKTALLLEIAAQARKKQWIVARVSAGPSMLDDIIDAVQVEGTSHLSRNPSHLSGVSAGALGLSVGLSFTKEANENYGFRTKLSLLCDRLMEAELGILVLIDEVQPNSDQMRQFASTYQLLIGDGKNLAVVMAGLPGAISNVLNDEVLTFLNRASKEWLEALAIGQVNAHYTTTFSRLGITASHELVKEAASSTQGFPYLLQLVGYYLVEYSGGTSITREVLNNALESALEDLDHNVFEATLRPLSKGDIEFLCAMAPDGNLSTTANVQRRLGGDKNRVQPYRARLIDAGVISSPRRGELEFAVPYLSDYLMRRYHLSSNQEQDNLTRRAINNL